MTASAKIVCSRCKQVQDVIADPVYGFTRRGRVLCHACAFGEGRDGASVLDEAGTRTGRADHGPRAGGGRLRDGAEEAPVAGGDAGSAVAEVRG